MSTGYVYKSSNIETACKLFLNEHFQDTYIEEVLDLLNCTEFVKECLLKKEYLDGEILINDSHIAIFIEKSLDGFDINLVNSNVKPYLS